MTDSAAIDNLLQAMADQDIVFTDGLITDGKLHRYHVEGDDKQSRNGWAIIHLDDRPAGQFGCYKRYGDHKFSWSFKDPDAKPLTPEERQAIRDKAAAKAAARAKEEAEKRAAAAKRAQALWEAADQAPAGHPYLAKKGVHPHGTRVASWQTTNANGDVTVVSDNALLVPLKDRKGGVLSLQAIFPDDNNPLGRGKTYLPGGAKRGLFFPIGKPPKDREPHEQVFILAEGFATAASIHEATGEFVMTCFDSGNLITVATQIRDAKPQAIILIAGDNDQWTTKPVVNPGLVAASNAADAVGGLVAYPRFPADSGVEQEDGKVKGPTDFNDLHQRVGLEAVAAVIGRALRGEPEPDPGTDPDPDPEPEYDPADYQDEDDIEGPPSDSALAHFSFLGYDGGTYYVFSLEKRQVMTVTKRDLTDSGLIELAPLPWWERYFGLPKDGGINKRAAAEWFFRTANSRGVYDPKKIRGRGLWRDKGRFIFHHGTHLTVDGVKTDIGYVASSYIYPMARQLPSPAESPMTSAEGAHLLKVANMIRWSRPGSAALLAGFCFLAPICGALKWRPHIWLTGAAGSGKSTIQSDYVHSMLRGVAVYGQGSSTEAGVRQKLRADALPVLLDEAESSTEADRRRIEGVLSLIRQSSTENQAETLKGTAHGDGMHFHIRSMFCLASINTNLEKKADVDRLTRLVIKAPKQTPESEAHWDRLSAELHKMSTDETLGERVMARALAMLPVIVESIDVFRRSAAKHFGGQREGDQFGTLLAGVWCMQRDTVPEPWEAETLIKAYEWDEHTEDQHIDDAERALNGIMSAKIRMKGSVGDLTVHELICDAMSIHRPDNVTQANADTTLKRHGIRVSEGEGVVLFGTGAPNLRGLVEGSHYVTDLRGQLMRIEGATNYGDKTRKFSGINSKCVSIPLYRIVDYAEPPSLFDDTPLT